MKKGAKVVCIFNFSPRQYNENLPVKDEVYTIRELVSFQGYLGLRLEEIVNTPHQYDECFGEIIFHSAAFRLLDETFAENLLSEISEEIEQEELVYV